MLKLNYIATVMDFFVSYRDYLGDGSNIKVIFHRKYTPRKKMTEIKRIRSCLTLAGFQLRGGPNSQVVTNNKMMYE